jgi:hypothetical protein
VRDSGRALIAALGLGWCWNGDVPRWWRLIVARPRLSRPPASWDEIGRAIATFGIVNGAPTAAQLLRTEGALLTRSHLRELGLGRAAVDAVFRACTVVVFPGSSRPHVRVRDYLELLHRSSYDNNRVR